MGRRLSTQTDGQSPFPVCFGSGSLESETWFLGFLVCLGLPASLASEPSLAPCFDALYRIAGPFSNPTLVFDISAKEEIWSGSGWCWQSWLGEAEGLEGSTLCSIPEPDWICVQVRPLGLCSVICGNHSGSPTGHASVSREPRRVGPGNPPVWRGLGAKVRGLVAARPGSDAQCRPHTEHE